MNILALRVFEEIPKDITIDEDNDFIYWKDSLGRPVFYAHKQTLKRLSLTLEGQKHG